MKTFRKYRQFLAFMTALLMATWQIAQPLQAATLYWNQTGTSTWVTGANWSDNADSGGTTGVVPGASDIAVFNQSSVNGATTATIAAATSIGGFIFNNTGTTGIRTDGTANRTFTIGTGGITINAGAGAVTFGTTTNTQRVPITLGGSQTWLNNSSNTFSLNNNNTIATGGFTLTFDGTGNITTGTGAISGTGGIIKNGSNTVTLGAVNTYTGGATVNNGVLVLNGANTNAGGGITVNGGILRLGNDAALGTAGNTLTINGGAIDVSAARLTTNNNAQNWNGDFTFLGTNTWNTGTGNVVMNASRAVTITASTLTVGGIISGVGFGLTKQGAGTLVLTGANSYSGATTVNGGTLALTNSNSYADTTTINGGTLSLGGSGTILSTSGVTIGNRGILTLDNTATNLADRVADAAAIVSSGIGTINFTHGGAVATNYAESLGALTLNAGALTINASQAAVSQTSAMTLASITRSAGGTLLYNGAGAGTDTRNQLLLMSVAGLPASGVLIPWAIVNDGTGTSFAQHTGAGTSLTRYAGTVETGAMSTWVAATNARPASDDSANNAARSVNTITLDSGVDLLGTTLSADRNITISGAGGGAILQTGGTSLVTANGAFGYKWVFGTNEAIFHVLGTLQIDRGNNDVFGGSSTTSATFTGSNGFTKSGAGTLIINAESAITGTYRLNEGVLELRRAAALNGTAQNVELNGGTLRLSNDTSGTAYVGNFTLNADSNIQIDLVTPGATSITHSISSISSGGGRVLSVTSNDITSGTAYGLTVGALTLTSAGAVFDVANNGTGTGTLTVGTISGAYAFIKAGLGDFVTNSTVSGYTTNVDIAVGRVGWANASGTLTENQIFSGIGGIIKSGAGTVNLTAANTFTGGVTITAGVLQFSTVSDNGGPASNLGQGTNGISMSGGTLSFVGSTSQSTNRAFVNTAAATLNNSGTGGATITYAGQIAAFALTLTAADVFNVGYITGGITQTGTTDDLTITSGTWNLSGTTKTIADDVIVNTSAVLNLNSTGVLTGLSGTSNGLYIRNAATINLNADNAYSTSTGLDFILIGDNSAGSPVLNTNFYTITTPRLDLGQDSLNYVGTITGSGSVTVGTSANLYQGIIDVGVSLLGVGNVYKLGAGTLTLSGVMSGMTGTTGVDIHSGILALDYTTSNAVKFVAANSLNLSGGALTMNGNATADTFESVTGLNLTRGSSVTLTGGSSMITLIPGGSQKVALSIGDITRAVGGSTIRFNLAAGTQDGTNGILTTQANTNGIIGGFATVNDGGVTSFATNLGGNIVAMTPTSQDNVTLWTTAQNITDSAGFAGTLSANTNITSLRFNAATASTVTIASGVVLNLSSGGILQTINAGGTSTIAGGRLQSGAGSELIFNVNNTTQRLEVTSQITGSAAVTKGGVGTLLLNSANNFYTGITSVLGGTLQVSGGNAIGDHSDLIVGGGQTSTLELLADEVIGNLTLGGENGSTAGDGVVSSINVGSSRLTFNQETAITMVGVLFTSGTGGTLVKSGSANWTNAAANPNFTGTFQVDQGLAIFNANVNQLSAATAVTINGSGSSLRLDADQTTANNRILNTATITLNNTAGITADALGFYQRRNGGSNTGNEIVGQLILGAGHNTIAADGTATGRIGTITFTNAISLVRNNLATLFVVGRGLGDTAVTIRGNVAFSVDPGGAIGGAGAGGTTTTSIYPYVVGETTAGAPSGAVNFGNSFVRINTVAAGFKPLILATEYINDNAAPATGTNNVRYTATNGITTPAAINSLVLDSASAIALTGSATSMMITSGAILAAGTGAHSIGTISGITSGSGGANPYYVYVTNPTGQLMLNTPLTSATQMVKSGAGTLILGSASNAFTDLYFNQGVVQVDAQNKLGTGALQFFGGTLKFTTAFDASLQADLSTAKTITLGTGGGTFDTGSFAISLANTLGNSGAGGLTKIGTGSLTLLAPAAYSGSTAVQDGSLILASGGNNRLPITTALSLGAGATAGVLQLGNGTGASNQTVSELSNSGSGGASNAIIGGDSTVSVLTVNQATQTDFSGSIGGVGTNYNNVGITKSGVGSLTLSGATLSFVGPLSVTAGDLNITGSAGGLLAPSALTVNAGATLNLLNGVGQIINLGSGAINLGAGTGPAILGLELGSTSAYDHFITTGAATTTGSVLINLTNLSGFGAGNYDLLKADAGGLSGATYTLGAAALGGVSLSLVPTDTLVQLQVSAIVGDLYWKGAVGAGWTAFNGANSNFTTDLAGTNNALGIPGTDNGVIFSANGQTNTALNTTLNTNFFIRDLTFNNILGSGPLDTISIAEGSGGSLTITPTVSTAGINLQTGAVGNVIISAPVVLGASQTWTVADAATALASSGGISGTANLIKAGSGILALAGSNTYVGTTTVNGGVLRANSTNAFNATSAHTIGTAGTLRLNGFAQTLSSLAGASGSILENGAASGNVVLTVGGSTSTTFAGTIQNGGTATLGLTKIGTGTFTLSGSSPSPTGNISINGGILAITGTTNNGVGALGTTSVGSSAGAQGLLYVPAGGSYTTTSLTVGGNATGVGSLVINGGTVTTTTPTVSVGLTMGGGGYGGLFISNGGSLTTHRLENNSTAATSVSVIQLSGGTLTADDYLIFRNNRWELTVTGGNLVHNTGSNNIALGYSGTSTFGVMTVAGGMVDNSTRNISFGQAAGSITASLNLNGGTLLTNAITSANGAVSYVNFNGGTLKVAAASATFLPTGVTAAYSNGAFGSYAGGAVVDTNGFNVTFVEPILSPVGTNGVSGLSVNAAGTGYIGAPYVEITGGGGGGATGYAVVDLDPASGTYGQITSVVLTNPGVGYTSAPTVSLNGGGGTGAVVTASGTVANTSGGLTKNGLGILTLSGANTYTGGTTINLGTLVLGASDVLADTGNVTINGGTFDVAGFGETVATVSLLGGTITGTTGVLISTTDYDLRIGTVDFTGSGGLSGTGNVTKTTVGTVALLNNGFGGNFSKAVNVNGGKLEFSASNQLGDASATNTIGINGGILSLITPTTVNLGATRTVAVGTAGATMDTSFALGTMNITGGITTAAAGNLTKTGPGTVTVTGTTNLNGGVVTVSGGTLNAGFSASGISGVAVANGGTLNLYDGSAVTAAITSLSLVNGSALGFDLNEPGTNDVLALTINAPVLTGTITVNLNDLGGLGVGTYDLITSTLGGLNGAAYMLGAAPSGPNYSFSTVSGDTILRLTVSSLTLRYWQGDQDGSWATNNTGNTNWASDENGGLDAGVLPAFTDTLVFSATNAPFTAGNVINITLDGSRTADSLRFLAAPVGVTAFTIAPGSGGTLMLMPVSSNNGISVADNAGAVTISAQIATGAVQTWEVLGTGANGSSLTISGDVSFNHSVTKTGAGALTLSGSNSGAGGLTINVGTLNLGSATAPGTGTLTLGPGITLDNTSGALLTLGNNNAVVVNGSFSFTGTHALDLGAGAFTLGINAIVQVVNSTLTVSGIIGDGGNAWSLGKAGTGILVLNGANTYDGLTNLLQGTLTLAGDNSAASGGVSTAAATLNINHDNALGSGTFSIGAGTIIDNTLGSLVTNAGNNFQIWNGSFTFTGTNSLDLGTGAVTLGSAATITTSGASTTLTVGGVIDDGVNTFNLTKAGAGTLKLSGLSATAANNYSGTTILNGGTLAITNTASLAGGLTFGTAGGTILSTLDLAMGSATFGGPTLVQTNSATANNIFIGSGQTLRLNGSVLVGATGNTTTVLTASGLGALTIGAAGAATNANVSLGGNVTTDVSNGATWDMSGLATFYANLGTGILRVGDLTNSGGTATKGSTLILAANSTILATTLTVASPDGLASNITESLKLGSGQNLINVNTINIGGDSTSRSSGTLGFNVGAGTLKVRNLADPVNGRATLNVANVANATTASSTSSFDTIGHSADMLLSTLTIASRTGASTGSATGIFSFDAGTLNADNLLVGNKAAATTGGNATGTVNLGGGSTIINNTTGPVQLGVNGAGNGTAAGTLNVSGGTVSIAAFGGTSIRLGQATAAGGAASGLVDITGGTLTVAGDILRGSTAGTSTATIALRGGTLDMGGNTIGSAVNQVTLTAESGTLMNLFRFNGGGTLIKTTAGTLILEGTNSYAGTTLISGGVLQIGGGTLGTGSTTGTLGSGGVTNNATLTFNRSNSYTVGNLISGTGAVIQAGAGTTVLTNANTYSGTTTISAGTLQLGNGTNGNDGTIGNSLSVVNNAALVYNRFGASTYGGVISGSGTVTKSGAGTQVLTGINTYSGTTTISNGILQLGDGTSGNDGTISNSLSIVNNGNLTYNRFATSGLAYGGVISGSGTVSKTGAGTQILTGVSIYNGTTTISAGTLQLGDGTTGNDGTISNSLSIVNNGNLTYNRFATSGLTYGGVISGNGTVTKTGVGTQILTGANTYVGTTTIAVGILQADHATALGSGGNITFTGGTLQYTANSAGTDWAARIKNSSAAIAIDTNTNDVTLAGIIDSSNTGGLSKSGDGTLTLSGVNAFTGTITLNGIGGAGNVSRIQISSDANLGHVNNAIVFAGGSNPDLQFTANMTLASTRNITLNAAGGGEFVVNTNVTVDYGGVMDGSDDLRKSSGGTLNLAGTSNSFAGRVLVLAGTLQVASLADSGFNSSLGKGTLGNDFIQLGNSTGAAGTLEYLGSGSSTNRQIRIGGGANANQNAGATILNNGTGALIFTAANFNNLQGNAATDDPRTLTLGGANTGANELQGVIADNTASSKIELAKVDAGTWILSGDNNYTGTSLITGGTLQVGNAGTTGSLGTGDVTITTGTLAFNRSNAHTVANNIGGTSGVLSQTGAGTTTLSGTNAYSGAIEVVTGTLQAGSTSAFGTSDVTVSAGAFLALNGNSNTIDGLAGAGTVENANAAAATLTVGGGNEATATFSGNLRNGTGGGALALTKIGTGTQTLSGASNYTGATAVSVGRLDVTGSLTSNITVSAAAVLGGEGSTTGSLTFTGSSILAVDGSTGAAFTSTGLTTTGATVTVNFDVAPVGTGDITILTHGGSFTGATTDFVVGTGITVSGRGGSFNNIAGAITLSTGFQAKTWVGGFSGNWNINTTANWSGGDSLFFNGDFVTFSDSATTKTVIIDGADVKPTSVNFTNTGTNDYTISSAAAETLAATGGISVTGSGNVTINLVIADPLTASTAVALSGSGSTTTLNGVNTFTGGTTVTNGAMLVAGNDQAFGATSQTTALTISNGGTLDIGSGRNFQAYGTGSIIVNGSGVGGLGAIVKNSGGTDANAFDDELVFAGDVTLGGTAGRFDIDGSITTSASNITLTKVGATSLFLTGDNSGAAIANIVANDGSIVANNTNAFGSAAVLINTGGAAGIANNRTIANDFTLAGGTLRQYGGGTTSGTYQGTIAVNANSTIDPNNDTQGIIIDGTLTSLDSTIVVTLGNGTTSITANAVTTGFTGEVSLNQSNTTFQLQDGVAFGGKLRVGGSGTNKTFALAAGATSATFSGNLLLVDNNLGDTNIRVENGGTLTFSGNIANDGNGSGIDIIGDGTAAVDGTVIFTGTNTYGGRTLLQGETTLQIGNGGTTGTLGNNSNAQLTTADTTLTFKRSDTYEYGGVISGTGVVRQEGSGTLALTGTNTYSGTTTVAAGTLQVGNGTSGSLDGIGNVSVNSSATLSGSGSIAGSTVINAGAILAPGTTTDATSTLTLSAANTAVDVKDGGQIQLGLTSSTQIDGDFNFATTDALTYLNNNDGTGGDPYTTIWGVAGSDYDSIKLTNGTFTLGDTTNGVLGATADGSIRIFNGSSYAVGTIFKLLDWSGLGSGTLLDGGGFNSTASNNLAFNTVLDAGLAWDTSAFTTYGVIVVVPEPSRLLFLMLGLLGLLLRRRRRSGI